MRRLDTIELRLLRIFVVLAEAGSFPAAQIALSLSQSTLSTQLEVGKKADFVVVSTDLFKLPPRRVHAAAADATVLDGKVTSGRLP
jgi:hypothetical protein